MVIECLFVMRALPSHFVVRMCTAYVVLAALGSAERCGADPAVWPLQLRDMCGRANVAMTLTTENGLPA